MRQGWLGEEKKHSPQKNTQSTEKELERGCLAIRRQPLGGEFAVRSFEDEFQRATDTGDQGLYGKFMVKIKEGSSVRANAPFDEKEELHE